MVVIALLTGVLLVVGDVMAVKGNPDGRVALFLLLALSLAANLYLCLGFAFDVRDVVFACAFGVLSAIVIVGAICLVVPTASRWFAQVGGRR